MWNSVGGGESFDCGLVVQDISPEADDFAGILEHMVSTTNHTWFDIERYDLATADELYQRTELIAYIVIPNGFGSNITSGQNATAVMYINNANDDVVKNYVHRFEAAVLLFNQGAIYPDFDQSGARIALLETLSLPATPSNLEYMAGVGLVLSFMSCALTSQAMLTASEFETNAIHDTLNSPTPRLALVLGRTLAALPRSFITLFITAPIICLSMNIFPTGNLLVLIGILILSALALAPIGELIGMKLRNREQALLASVLFVVAGFIAGGGMAPIGLSPQIVQIIVGIFPTTHILGLWGRVFFNDTLLGLTTSAAALVLTWIILSVIVYHLMKKEVQQG